MLHICIFMSVLVVAFFFFFFCCCHYYTLKTVSFQPPPVPNRPVSYTPSTHDSLNVLNNLDSVRNYGSAADELETTGTRQRIPDFSEYLASFSAPAGSHSRPSNASSIAPSLPPPPASNPNSDTESLQKASWEFEYPNILGSYEGDFFFFLWSCL